MKALLIAVLCVAGPLSAQVDYFDNIIVEVNRGRYDRAVRNVAMVQAEIYRKLGAKVRLDPDVMRRMADVAEQPTAAAALSTTAFLRTLYAEEKWKDAAGEATIVSLCLSGLWTKTPAYKKLEFANEDYAGASWNARDQARLRLSFAALDAGEWALAKQTAAKMLQLLASGEARGDANVYRHAALTVLGLVALQANDLKQAEERLAESVKSTVEVPNFRLAGDLLDKGRREAVVQYLTALGEMKWSGAGKVKGWKDAIALGERPNFDN